ncbi:PQQ-binding-like beta-propeller repeat protein, partial [Chloroflexota bacterium]
RKGRTLLHPLYWSPVTVGDDLAFVGFAEAQNSTAAMYAFDPATGEELWNVPAELFVIPAPTYAGDVVYFGDTAGNVYAVDIESRSIKPGWPFVAESAIWASPLVVGDSLFVASMDHHVYSLDRESGEVIWQQEVGGAGYVPCDGHVQSRCLPADDTSCACRRWTAVSSQASRYRSLYS